MGFIYLKTTCHSDELVFLSASEPGDEKMVNLLVTVNMSIPVWTFDCLCPLLQIDFQVAVMGDCVYEYILIKLFIIDLEVKCGCQFEICCLRHHFSDIPFLFCSLFTFLYNLFHYIFFKQNPISRWLCLYDS